MNEHKWECRTKVRFGKEAVKKYLPEMLEELSMQGKIVMLGYGSGSLKKNGAYDDVMAVLKDFGCKVIEFSNRGQSSRRHIRRTYAWINSRL